MRACTRHFLVAGATLVVTLVAGLMPVRTAEAHNPPFFWMPDLSVHSRESVENGLALGTIGPAARVILQTNLYIELAVSRHISIMGRIPTAYAMFDPPLPPDQTTHGFGLGNISGGAQFAMTTELKPEQKLLYGVGMLVYLPTHLGVGPYDGTANAISPITIPDAGRFLEGVTTLRARGSLRFEFHDLFVQGETVLDRRMLGEGEDRNDMVFGLGAGYQLTDYVGLLAEFSIASDIVDLTDDNDYTTVIDAGVRYHNPQTMISLRAYMPMDDIYREAGFIGIMLDAGMRY